MIIVVLNQKGGAGKTTTAVTLGAIWAEEGDVVYILDADPQLGGSSGWLLKKTLLSDEATELPKGTKSLRGVYFEEHGLLEAAIEVSPRLWLVPSDKSLKDVETVRPPGGESALREAIDALPEDAVVIIDCPPSLGLLAVSALVAGNQLVIPVRASGLDLPAVRELNGTLRIVRRRLNPQLETVAVLVTDSHPDKLTDQTFNSLRNEYEDTAVMKIRHSVRAGEAPTLGRTLPAHAPDATTTKDYRTLANRLRPGSVTVKKHRGLVVPRG
ncbi:ParA family protein [Kitasatospora sp. HPMI-4]|uniref:ParA family protein n=1 Tax=Kitasatospora sp. HPMI-4 TaxID=3448443 RepID=UPI003F1E12CD